MKHNYPRAKNIPTPGYAAGPCLVKDTMQLLAFARNEFALGNAAILVNEGLPLHIISDLRRHHDLTKMTVGLLGMAFKAEIDDVRASLSYKFKKALESCAQRGADHRSLRHHRSGPAAARRGHRAQRLLILCTPHSIYKSADLKGKPVVDVWGILENANVVYLSNGGCNSTSSFRSTTRARTSSPRSARLPAR